MIIADQIPVRLAPDAIKNTNLKIAHHIVAADDRDTLAAAMAMDEPQGRSLAVLPAGQAAVFSEGNGTPILVPVRLVKDALADERPSDADVTTHMTEWRARFAALFRPTPWCDVDCPTEEVCVSAGRIAAAETVRRTIARMVQSAMEDGAALDRMRDDLVA